MSAVSAGSRVIWLVVATSWAALGVFAFSVNSDLSQSFEAWPKAMALCSVGWLLLSFFLLRRQQWARWIAVAILSVIGFALSIWELGDLLDSIAMGQHVEWNVTLVVGLVFVVDAVLLTFPNSAGDFFARPERLNWLAASGGAPSVRSANSNLHRDALLESLPQKEIMARRLRRITAIAIASSWIICAGAVAWKAHQRAIAFQEWQKEEAAAYRAAEESVKNDPTETTFAGHAFVGGVAQTERLVDIIELLVFGYLVLFVFPFLLTLPFVLPFARRWHEPVRFLILRPFNRENITTGLSRFLRKELAPFGHCYTLSDQQVRVPLHVRIPLLLGQLSFFNFRARRIRRPQQVEKVVQGMQKRVRRNINWCFSGTKLFPISCCDPGWQACVTRLVSEVDVIVADVSNISEAIAWELELLRDSGAVAKTVFVVAASRAGEARDAIAKVMGRVATAPVLAYGDNANATRHIARDSVLSILDRGTAAGSQGPRSHSIQPKD